MNRIEAIYTAAELQRVAKDEFRKIKIKELTGNEEYAVLAIDHDNQVWSIETKEQGFDVLFKHTRVFSLELEGIDIPSRKAS